MSGSDSRRIAPNRVGLSLVLLLVAWLVFSFYPRDKAPPPAAPPPVVESRLRAVGLRDNLDWEGMPEIFAIWADQAEWQDGKTRFAYWHPVMKTYSYYFEAIRADGGYRFKEITEPSAPDFYWDESLGEDCPIRFYRSPPPVGGLPEANVSIVPPGDDPVKPKLDIPAPQLQLPGSQTIPMAPVPKPE